MPSSHADFGNGATGGGLHRAADNRSPSLLDGTSGAVVRCKRPAGVMNGDLFPDNSRPTTASRPALTPVPLMAGFPRQRLQSCLGKGGLSNVTVCAQR